MDLTYYRTLGKSGLKVSPITLGAMTFGEDWGWGADPAASKAIIAKYLSLGGNIIDTANTYTFGHSEKIIGDYLKENRIRRDSVVLSTKFFGNMYPGDPNGGGASRRTVINSLEQSLRRLQTDYIDLYWLHAYDPFTPVEETLSALQALITSGKVRYIAVSDMPAWKVAESQMIAHFRGWSSFIGLQLEYSLLERTVEGELIPMAGEMGLGVMPWSPLGQGVLSGKYTRANNGRQESGRFADTTFSEKTYDIIDKLVAIAQQKQVTPAEVALAWVISRQGVTSTIIGARTMEQLDNNLQALAVTLTADEIQALDEVSAPVLSFPIPFIGKVGAGIMQAGTRVNGRPSVVPPLLPASPELMY